MLEGLMQDDYQLTVQALMRRARTVYADRQVVTLLDPTDPEGTGVSRASFREVGERVDRLAHALARLGLREGDRVGTFAWNTQRHLELYLTVPSVGMVLHTLNIRLLAEQIAYVITHAGDRAVFVDDSLVPLLAPLAADLPTVEHFVVMGDGPIDGLPRAVRYEEILSALDGEPYSWPDIDEGAAASLCYTSGTTGDPKGVLYSHRSIALHATALCMADTGGISSADRLLPIVPMFHVNAWGTPYAAALTGASLVMPGAFLQGAPLADLIAREKVTTVYGVPTVMADLLRHVEAHPSDLTSVKRGICGGSAVSLPLMQGFDRLGIDLIQGWGMTETSPVLTVALPPPEVERESDEFWRLRASQGRNVPWVELRVMGEDGPLPWDGRSVGEIEVRGPWVADSYFEVDGRSNEQKFNGSWLRTGDLGTIDARGYVRLTDRVKDLIKSGGEWISSVDLENAIMSHPSVIEAAVVARPDPRWGERPLAFVVCDEEARIDAVVVQRHLESLVARWWLPEDVVFVEEIPKTSVGKFDKKALRLRPEVTGEAGPP
jgi:fatty-acyl-CoA synthase